ncbi:hypothetical protein BDR26DRAFT_933198 [Obelidium mucronatum]|nr:hypothetical protein BDR26DRAFT_933198 [Obelidium mucronatum]
MASAYKDNLIVSKGLPAEFKNLVNLNYMEIGGSTLYKQPTSVDTPDFSTSLTVVKYSDQITIDPVDANNLKVLSLNIMRRQGNFTSLLDISFQRILQSFSSDLSDSAVNAYGQATFQLTDQIISFRDMLPSNFSRLATTVRIEIPQVQIFSLAAQELQNTTNIISTQFNQSIVISFFHEKNQEWLYSLGWNDSLEQLSFNIKYGSGSNSPFAMFVFNGTLLGSNKIGLGRRAGPRPVISAVSFTQNIQVLVSPKKNDLGSEDVGPGATTTSTSTPPTSVTSDIKPSASTSPTRTGSEASFSSTLTDVLSSTATMPSTTTVTDIAALMTTAIQPKPFQGDSSIISLLFPGIDVTTAVINSAPVPVGNGETRSVSGGVLAGARRRASTESFVGVILKSPAYTFGSSSDIKTFGSLSNQFLSPKTSNDGGVAFSFTHTASGNVWYSLNLSTDSSQITVLLYSGLSNVGSMTFLLSPASGNGPFEFIQVSSILLRTTSMTDIKASKAVGSCLIPIVLAAACLMA